MEQEEEFFLGMCDSWSQAETFHYFTAGQSQHVAGQAWQERQDWESLFKSTMLWEKLCGSLDLGLFVETALSVHPHMKLRA